MYIITGIPFYETNQGEYRMTATEENALEGSELEENAIDNNALEYNPPEDNALEQVGDKIRKNRGWLLFLGIVMVILGTVGLSMEVTLTVVSVFYFGFLILFGGIVMLIDAFRAGKWKSKFWHVLIALSYMAAAIVMIVNPAASAVWITLFLAGFFVVTGLLRLIIGFQSRGAVANWGWIVFAGLISMALGGIIFAEWPVSGLWVIGMFIAIELILQGFSMISIAWAARAD